MPQGIAARTAFPADGASGVPLNARVVVLYRAHEPGYPVQADGGAVTLGDDLQLVRRDGVFVEVRKRTTVAGPNLWQRQTAVVLEPLTPLAAGSEYELLDMRGVVPCGQGAAQPCAWSAPSAFSRFSTGASDDRQPPSFAGLGSLTPRPIHACDSSGCCGPFRVHPFLLGWPAASDAVSGGSVLYTVYRAGDPAPVTSFLSPRELLLGVNCGPGYQDPSTLTVLPGSFLVRAVDWAGNEDLNQVARPLEGVCQGAIPDAGPLDGAPRDVAAHEVGAGLPVDAAGPVSGGGCTVGVTTAAPSLLVPLVLLLVGALFVHRRR